ncbi:MAG: hypothetical protein LBR48_03210 [Dysgonamonadaceae bacterium]|jgi:hypothetical protein|nr:hypothetical protein [Dysgonamonadaceae bacterium]
MGIEDNFYGNFMQTINALVPEKRVLTNSLSKILSLEKESVYRRLRGEVSFSLNEIIKISRHYGLSIDALVGISQPYRGGDSYHLYFQDFNNLSDVDYKNAEDYIKALDTASHDEKAEFGYASSTMPLHILAMYPNLYRFYMMKWKYYYNSQYEKELKYCHVVRPERLTEQHARFTTTIQNIPTIFILDERLLPDLIRDIKYFHTIRMITDEEVRDLKNDLLQLLQVAERVAEKAAYPNGIKVEMYASGLSMDTSYAYLYGNNIFVSMINAYTLEQITSTNRNSCDFMREWMRKMKRTSMSLSTSEFNRIKYFDSHNKLLDAEL